MIKTNVLILGKSGAGKSALINYLWEKKVTESAAGRPVTPKESSNGCGLYPCQPIEINGLEVIIHDSWGVEADKASDWIKLINGQIQNCDASNSVSDWFHTIIYCVSAKGARFEDFEINSIIHPLIKQGNSIIFALTKSNAASNEEYEKMHAVIHKAFPNSKIVKVDSKSETKRNGKRTEAFGREELSRGIMYNLRTNLIQKIKANFSAYCTRSSDDWKSNILKYYDAESSLFKTRNSLQNQVQEHAKVKLELLLKSIDQWLTLAIDDALIIFSKFGVVFHAAQYMEEHEKVISNFKNKVQSTEWSGVEVSSNWIMNIIPLLNFAYWAVGHGLHRDFLEEKLKVTTKEFDDQIKVSLKKIEEYLSQKLVLRLS